MNILLKHTDLFAAFKNALNSLYLQKLNMRCGAENLVAAFQGQPATLFGVAKSARDAKILLEALEIGTDGVVLRTDDAAEARCFALNINTKH